MSTRNILAATTLALVLGSPAAFASSKGVATGAVGGAVTGAVVGGPVGAVVGGAAGAVVGAAVTSPDRRGTHRRPCNTRVSKTSNGDGTATVTKTRTCG